MDKTLRGIICNAIRETNGLVKVKPCDDGFGFLCSYKIVCNQAISEIQGLVPEEIDTNCYICNKEDAKQRLRDDGFNSAIKIMKDRMGK